MQSAGVNLDRRIYLPSPKFFNYCRLDTAARKVTKKRQNLTADEINLHKLYVRPWPINWHALPMSLHHK